MVNGCLFFVRRASFFESLLEFRICCWRSVPCALLPLHSPELCQDWDQLVDSRLKDELQKLDRRTLQRGERAGTQEVESSMQYLIPAWKTSLERLPIQVDMQQVIAHT